MRRKTEGYKVTLEDISRLKAELDAAKATLDKKKAEQAQAKLDAAVANQDHTMAQLLAKAQQLCRDIKAKGEAADDERYALEGVMQISLKLATQLDPEATKTGRGLYVTLDETENPELIKQGRDAGMIEAAVAQMAVDQRNWLRKLWRSEVMKDQTNAEILYLRDLGLQGSRDGMTLQQVISKVVKKMQKVDPLTQQAALNRNFNFENATPEQLAAIYQGVIGSAGQTNAGVNASTGAKKEAAADVAKTDATKVSKHAAGDAPVDWQAKVVKSVPSATVVSDDPGHIYHLRNDGKGVTTTEPKLLAPELTRVLIKQIPVPTPAMSVTNGPDSHKPGKNIQPNEEEALKAQQPDLRPVVKDLVHPKAYDDQLVKPDAASATNLDGKIGGRRRQASF